MEILFDETHSEEIQKIYRRNHFTRIFIYVMGISVGTFVIVGITDLISRIAILIIVCGFTYMLVDPYVWPILCKKNLPISPVLTDSGIVLPKRGDICRRIYKKGHPYVIPYANIKIVRWHYEKKPFRKDAGTIFLLYEWKERVHSLFL